MEVVDQARELSVADYSGEPRGGSYLGLLIGCFHQTSLNSSLIFSVLL
jgi:hypothetical protein